MARSTNGERLGEMLTPWGFTKFCATSAGSLCGSTFTLFAKNKVKKYFSLQQSSERTALTKGSDDNILSLVMKSKSVMPPEPSKKEACKTTPKSTPIVNQSRFSLFREIKEGYDLFVKDIGVIPFGISLCTELITRVGTTIK